MTEMKKCLINHAELITDLIKSRANAIIDLQKISEYEHLVEEHGGKNNAESKLDNWKKMFKDEEMKLMALDETIKSFNWDECK